MKAVKMLQDEVVSWGPQRLLKDSTPELPDDLAASLVGRGLAVYAPITHVEVEIESAAVEKSVRHTLQSMTVTELKEVAKESDIDGYATMKKAELIEVLMGELSD